MLRIYDLRPIHLKEKEKTNNEISRILSAAVINAGFCSSLLKTPATAIDSGYYGEFFNVNAQDKAKIKAIHASNLVDFATQITQI
ncbi:MAG: hypothetical protein GYA18_05110 [Chloroflexi bacterium]|nr:hypothetical protein [Chloroflexota bacterium]